MAALAGSLKSDGKLTIGGEIGRGVYGTTYEGELNGKQVVVKRIHRVLLEVEGAEWLCQQFVQSAYLMKHLSHPHIVKIIEFYHSVEGDHVLVMERLDCKLREYLDNHVGNLSRQRQIDFCLQIADAIHYLHSQQPPVVCRDLTGNNVLWRDDMLKLCSTLQAARLPSCGHFDERAPGVFPYMPPEALVVDSHYNEKIDIFSLGVLMLEISTQNYSLTRLSGIGTTPEIQRRAEDLSRLPEDHPLKPIILQCLRDDPGERPDSGAVFRMLSEVSPILQAAYKEALDKHGSVSVDVIQCIFVGPSAVGKSTLKHVLVHDTPKAVKTSTAVMATPEVVTITSEQYAVEGGTSAWQLVDSDVMGKSLRACINTRAFDDITQYPSEAEVNWREQAKQESSSLVQGDTLPRSPLVIPVHQQQRSNSTRTQAGAIEGSLAQASPIDMLDSQHSQMLQEIGGDGERIQLNNASFVHLLDTGGQPSFQDALPLLLDVPCTYIQAFNAARDLDQPVPITYRRDDHTEESLPPNTETGWEMMLRSFSSMHTLAHKRSKELATFQQEKDQLPQLRIFVVGTFKDQLVEEGRCGNVVQDICRRLRGLKRKPYYQSIKWDGNQPFYLINGMSVAGEEKVCINNLRKHLSSQGSALKLNVPVMWYVCRQITQRVPLKFFKFNDLKDFCLKHHFIEAKNADSQFHSLLKLFSLLGFYAFFNLKDVPDEANFVCTDRGVFLKEVSKLLAVQFAAARSPSMERLKETGILVFNIELFEELGISQEMDLHWFLNSLCYLGIAARLPTKERAEYFIPAVLPQKAVHQTPSGSVVPLCFTYRIKEGAVFACNDLPQGLFCRLAVDLIRQQWKIIENQSTRTLLKFRWKEFEIFLQECPGYISLIPRVVEELPSVSELHAGCVDLYHTVAMCLSHSTEDTLGSHFSTVAELVVGFECSCTEVNIPHIALQSSTGKSLTCSETSSCQIYTKQQRIWFSTVDGATLKFFLHNKFWSLENSACKEKLPEASDAILSQTVYDRPGYLMLFRKHVSRRAADKGRAVLEGVGLDATTIQTCFEDNPRKIEEAVQNGLTKWSEGQGLPATWQVLCESMEYAEIGQQHLQSLKTALGHHAQ